MTDDEQMGFNQLKQAHDETRQRLERMENQLRNFRVADESGGGQLILAEGNATLRLNSLTPSGSQI